MVFLKLKLFILIPKLHKINQLLLMKILAINNYSLEKCLKDSENLNGPAHHNWGCDYFIQNGHKVEVICFKNSGGIKNKILNLFFCLQNIKYFNQFDIIIAFANPIMGWCALLKNLE